MSLVISVSIQGDKEVLAKLKRLGSGMYDFSKAMKEIGEQGKKYFSGPVFASEGGALGEPWRDLTRAYEERKAKKWRGRGILVASGTMRDSFYEVHDKMSVLISNDAPQFIYHQSTAPRKKLPRRPMIAANTAFQKIVQVAIRNDIQEKLRRLS
jgi:hypothetical protein